MDETQSDDPNAICPSCGAPLDPGVAHGLCPKCALAGVGAETEAATSQPPIAFEPPPIERVAAAFPQLEIIELIGRGGMGAVYKARQLHLDRLVALKLLPETLAVSPEFTERFTREARTLAKLNHPNIVTVHDFGHANGFFFLILEFVDGVNLREAMRAGQFTPEQALEIVPKVCEALQFAHEEGVLHRDVKPENILLDAKGRVKIADFGIAKLVGVSAAAGPTLTGTMAPGTPQYMAPEQIESPANVDHRADIYSLGVVFYEMLTGELPLGRFAAPSEKSAVDSQVDEIVFRALEKERERRQQSADEVRTEVETIAVSRERHPAYAIPTVRQPRGENPRPPSLVWPAFLAAFLIAAGILISMGTAFFASLAHSKSAHARAEAEAQHHKLMSQITEQQAILQEKENELDRYAETHPLHLETRAQIDAARVRISELDAQLAVWNEKRRQGMGPDIRIGWIPATLFFGLLALPGIILGWRTLARHRLIGVPNGFVACSAGFAALFLPLLVIGGVIFSMFRDQDLALITALVVSAILIWLVWRWLKSPPAPEEVARFQATWKPAAAGERTNPWPRRIFWLIVLICVLPVILILISLLVASLAYQQVERNPGGKAAGESAVDRQPSRSEFVEVLTAPDAIGGSISSMLSADASLDPPNRYEAVAAVHAGYLMTWTVEIEDSDGARFPVEGLECWIANDNFHAIGKMEESGGTISMIVRWLIRDGQIQCMRANQQDDSRFPPPSGELNEFGELDWKQFRGETGHWFAPGGWKIGSTNDFQLFETSEGHRIWARVALHPMHEKVYPHLVPDGLSNNGNWKHLIHPKPEP